MARKQVSQSVDVPISRRTKRRTRLPIVAIIGAGFAGLAAAKEFKDRGCDPLILEARNRPGGRCYTETVDLANGSSVVLDLGAGEL
jgi:monoamine oxidase